MGVVGEYRGLDAALADVLAHYQPGPEGLASVDGCVITLPIEMWGQYAWVERVSASLSAGQGTAEVLYTVPADERNWLEYIYASRASGDNTVSAFRVIYPEGYFGGASGNLEAAELVTPTTQLYWPDPGGAQTLLMQMPTPAWLEPLTTVSLIPAGAGVGVSVFTSFIRLRRTKLIRHRDPFPA